ncbi:MAG: prolipoprotein diacylglyceryl transferase [Aquificae bacterium]|nr:prolipoprotein diacylglyceryl transferase [Aquificota bacterium]
MCPELFRIGDFVISTYGVLVAIGMIVSFYIFLHFAKKEGIKEKQAENLFILTIIGGLVGARFAYILEHHDQFKTFVDYIAIWKGGIDWFGGFIGGIITALILIKIYKINLWKVADAAAIAIIIGHGIGRLGCTAAGCCYGKPVPEHSFWEHFGLKFPEDSAAPPGMTLYPTQPLEAFFNFVIFGILFLFYRKKLFDGQIFGMYLVLYGTERFLLEFIRNVTPPIEPIGLTWNQIISMTMVVVGVSILLYKLKSQRLLETDE